MSAILASKDDKLVLAWDIEQGFITKAGSSSGPKDPIRMMIQENTWEKVLDASPYRVTYVSFSWPIIAGTDRRRIASHLRSIARMDANIVDCQILQDVKAVPKEINVQSEIGDNGLVFCTFPALKQMNNEVGLCKRIRRDMIENVVVGRFSALAIYTSEEIKMMSKVQI